MARVGFVVGEDFEDVELRVPLDRIGEAGHEVVIIGAEKGQRLAGKRGKEHISVEVSAQDVKARSLDALVIPGGYSPDHLRTNEAVVRLIRAIDDAGKPLAAVCHGPSLLIDAEVVRGRTVTSWPSIKKDLQNAGARWIDEEVAQDGNLITSRNPSDLQAFSSAVLRQMEQEPAPAEAAAQRDPLEPFEGIRLDIDQQTR